MSSFRASRTAFLPPSSLIEQKRKDYDYLMHQYRLHAIEGIPFERPIFHGPSQRYNRNASAKAPQTKTDIVLPRATNAPRRPKTSKERTTIKRSPYAVKKNNYVASPRASKERQQMNKRPETSKPKVSSNSKVNTRNNISPRKRPVTSRERGAIQERPISHHSPNKTPRLRPSTVRPIKSQYSRDVLNKDFARHMYIRNHILQRKKLPKAPTPEDEDSDEYSEFFESSSEDSDTTEESPAPSLTPSPPPINEEERQDLFDEDGVDTRPTPLPEPVLKELENVDETFIPPSTIYKIDKNASLSESSEDEPICIVKDGKPGTYKKKKNGEYVLVDEKKRKKRMIKKLLEKQQKRQEEKDKEKEKEIDQNIYYIDYQNMNSDENDADDEAVLTGLNNQQEESCDSDTDDENKNNDQSKSEPKKPEPKPEPKPELISLNAKYMNENSDNEDANYEIDKKEETQSEESENDDEKEKESQSLVEKFSNLRKDTPQDFDAKKQFDSDSDVDEFGRRKDRMRPSSSLFDFLPPLRPDPILDNSDVNNCKIRLLRDAVNIHEALLKNEGLQMEYAVELIISYNCDNRRWIRKIYRDEYLQSLLLDLRKCLPADVASIMSYLMIPTCEFDAMCLWDSLKGLHKDPDVLCEILCTRNNRELAAIRGAYFMRYDEHLIDHIEDETTGFFQKMLMRLALGKRDEDVEINKPAVVKDARALSVLLREIGGELLDKKMVDVFCQLSVENLRVLLTEYHKFKGYDIDGDVIKHMTGDFSRCILILVSYLQNPPNFFVKKLHKTHFQGADDDKGLCRIIISRSERDLEMIKQLFVLRYGMELFEYVSEVCHGSLKGLILRLLVGNISKEERERMDMPPLFIDPEELKLNERLSVPAAIQMVLRKTKVILRLLKVLNIRRDRMNQESSSEASENEFELDPEQENQEHHEAEEEEAAAELDSEEEEERLANEAQRELRNGLKNISFAPDVMVFEEGAHKSVFQDVSFAAASRGILKNADNESADEEEDPNKEIDIEDDNADNKPAGPKMTQLNGPVLDPTFTGHDERKTSGKLPLGKKKKKVYRGTVKGIDMMQFNALKDAQAVGKAILQKNRNVEGILQFLATRNNAQRQLIIREFFRRYRRDLVDDLRTLAPHHEEVTLALLLSSEIFDSASLYAAFQSGKPEATIDVLIEILCSRPNDEIALIKRAFNGIFGMDLHEEIVRITKGPFQNLLCTIADCQRDEGDIIDENLAKKDAQALYEAVIKSSNARDYDIFTEIFGTRTFAHISAVCDNFAKIARLDILEILNETLEMEFLEGLTAIICNVRDPSMFFCEKIYRAVSTEEPDYSLLIRCVVSRAEIDLQVMKGTFRRTYGRSIYNIVEKECDFKSKKIILNVVKK